MKQRMSRVGAAGLVLAGCCAGACAAPVNDSFSAGISMGTTLSWTTNGSNVAGTLEAGEVMPSAKPSAQASVWWTWQAPADAHVDIDTFGSTFDTVLGVYTGSVVAALGEVASNDNSGGTRSKVSFVATVGTTYSVAVYSGTAVRGNIRLNLTAIPIPSNDSAASAFDLGSAVPAVTNGANFGAGAEGYPGEPPSSVWYRWQAPGDGQSIVTISPSGFSGSVAAYAFQAATSNLVALATNVSLSQTFDVGAGEEYFLAVGGAAAGQEGSFNFLLQFLGGGTGGDFDMFDEAAGMGSGSSWTTNASNVDATLEFGEPRPLDRAGASVWFAWTAPTNGPAVVTTTGTIFDTVLGIYTGPDLASLTEVAANDDRDEMSDGLESWLVFEAYQGTTYHIVLHGYNGAQGPFALNLSMPAPPANDEWTNAVDLGSAHDIPAGLPGLHRGTTVNATDDPAHGLYNAVWYKWTAPADGFVKTETRADFREHRECFELSGSMPTALASDRFVARAGTNYYIAVSCSSAGIAGQGEFSIGLRLFDGIHDDWEQAQDLGSAWDFERDDANDYGIDQGLPGEPHKSVWYRWQAPANGTVRVAVEAEGDEFVPATSFYLLDGPGPTFLAEDDEIPVRAGQVYYIAVGASMYSYDADDTFRFRLTFNESPLNDFFDDAIGMGSSTSWTTNGNNLGATTEPAEPDPDDSGGRSVWYAWTAPADGAVSIDTGGGATDFDTVLGVYTGATVSVLTEMSANDDFGDGGRSRVAIPVAGGETYRIAVHGSSGDEGSFVLSLASLNPPPNDNFESRAVLLGSGDTRTADLTDATTEPGERNAVGRDVRRTAWWEWTCPVAGFYEIEFVIPRDTNRNETPYQYQVADAFGARWGDTGTVRDPRFLAQTNVEQIVAVAGAAYYIMADEAPGVWTVSVRPAGAPINDDFAAAADLDALPQVSWDGEGNRGAGLRSMIMGSGDNWAATIEGSEAPPPDPWGLTGQKSVWFTWTATASGTAFFDLWGSGDQFSAVWTGTNIWELTRTDYGWGKWDDRGLLFNVIAGSQYRVAVYSEGGDPDAGGDFDFSLDLWIPPVNDEFANATDLGAGYFAQGAGENAAATAEGGDPDMGGYEQRSAWWRWQAPADGVAVIEDDSSEKPVFGVFAGPALGSLTMLAATTFGEDHLEFGVSAGEVYYIAYGGDFELPMMGSPKIRFEIECFPAASNDDFANAEDLGSGVPMGGGASPGVDWRGGAHGTGTLLAARSGSNRGATLEPGENYLPQPGASNSVWYTWTATNTGRAFLEFNDGDVIAAVYAGGDLASLTRVDQAMSMYEPDDRYFDAIAGAQYRIAVYADGTARPFGENFEFDLALVARPANDDFVNAGDMGEVSVASAGANNMAATIEAGEPNSEASVWWQWRAPSGRRVTIEADTGFEAGVSVFEGADVSSLTSVAFSSSNYHDGRWLPARGVSFTPTAGTTYRIAIDSRWADWSSRGDIGLSVAVAPINDDMVNAVDMGSGPFVTVAGANFGATAEDGESYGVGNSVWWKWKAPADTEVRIDTFGSDFATSLRVYEEGGGYVIIGGYEPGFAEAPSSMMELVELPVDRDAREGRERADFQGRRGKIYYIAVEGRSGFGIWDGTNWTSMPSRGRIALRVATSPANDDFERAAVLPSIPSVTVTGSTYGAGGQPDEPGSVNAESAWWRWESPATGLMSVDTFGSKFDTVLGVYAGTNIGQLVRVRECDDAETNGQSRVAFFAQAGSNYHFRVSGSGENVQGEVVMHVNAMVSPTNAAGHVAWGRAYLEERTAFGLHAADDHFAEALALDAGNPEANLLRGLTRFVLLQQEPEFDAMLGGLGVVTVSNDLYHAKYDFNTDTNGVPIPAAGATTALPVDYMRNHVEPRLEEVRTMWDRLTNSGFRAVFSDAETGSALAQVDYGDVLMLRGLPPAAKALWTLFDTYNLSASLETAYQMARDGQFDAQHVADTFQQILEFRSAGRREEFRTNYLAANDAYQAASDYIRNLRVTGDPKTHVFMLQATNSAPWADDEGEWFSLGAGQDEDARINMAKAADSFGGMVVDFDGQQVALADFVSTPSSLRDFLPDLVTNKVVAFSTPDVTFGGTWRNGTHTKIHDMLRSNDLLYEVATFSSWAAQYLAGLPADQRGPLGNPDNDPLNNLLEFAFNLDPNRPNVAAEFAMPDVVPVSGAGAGNYLTLTFVRRTDTGALRYVVAVSDDLVNWDRTEAQVEQWGGAVPTGDGATEQVTYRLKLDVRFAGRKFLRLEVTELE